MMSDKRILELADRLVASGPKCCAVSASECHEIRDYIHDSEAELQAKLLEQREACANKAKIKFSTAPDTYQQRVIDKDSILNATIEEG